MDQKEIIIFGYKLKTSMKLIVYILTFTILSSCSAEERITEKSYTNEWYFFNNQRYQVYKKNSGKKYILVINKRNTKIVRLYIKN